jgi:tRNA(Ile)-lysidine synthase
VAVSGGIDSVALLRLLLELRGELGIVLSVVHFNHKLRGAESDADEQFVAALACEHDLELHADSGDVAGHAREARVSVEAAARELRYGFFRRLLGDVEPSFPRLAKAARRGAPQDDQQEQKYESFVADDGAAESCAPSRQRHTSLDKIATGHTLDDQAETVLMRMLRGAGMRGLGGIYPRIPIENDEGEICGEIVRPLLITRRRELEQYLRDVGQTWREDSTNADAALTRNRVRKLVVPLLEREFNPAVAENLAELAEIARGEEDYWENEVAGWMGTTVHWSEPERARETALGSSLVQIGPPPISGPQGLKPGTPKNPSSRGPEGALFHAAATSDLRSRIANAPGLVMNASLSRLWLLGEPIAVQRRLVKAIGEQAGIPLAFKHVEEILRFAAEDGGASRELSLPLGWKVRRQPDELVFLTPDLRAQQPPEGYDYELPIPGQIVVSEAGLVIEALRVPPDVAAAAGYDPDQLLDAELSPGPFRVRNWRPGDRFWPAHTKSPKKIKELLQEHHVAQAERRLWPVVVRGDVSGGEIVWVRGFPVPAKLRAMPGREAVRIVDRSSNREPTA